MIKNLLLAVAVVFAGIAVLFLVFTLLDLLGAYVKYKKAIWELELSNLEIASKLLNPKTPKED